MNNQTGATVNMLAIEKQFEDAKRFIAEHQSFLLATHARTDGDDCGSMLAMKAVLESLGKEVKTVALGGVPESLQFLPNQKAVLGKMPYALTQENCDAIILFGCGRIERTGFDEITNAALPILNIDHHHDNKLYGTVNVLNPKKSSVAEMVYDFIKYLGIPFNPDVAKCLLTGMFTDTGSFMHSNTQASTFAAAAELMNYGARIDTIYKFTYANKDINALKSWSKALENTRLVRNGQIAISIIASEDLGDLGNPSKEAFDGFVEQLNKIPGTRFAMLLRQDGDVVKGSLRSEEHKETDVSTIAHMLGGGGHKLAAGFEIPGKIIRLPEGGWKIEKP